MSEHNEQQLSIYRLLMRLNGLLHRRGHQMRMQRGPMGDPGRGQGRVLALLKLQPEISQKQLGYLLDMRPQSLGELLGKLEAAGYILRTPSEADRRAMQIQLTEQGKQAAEQTAEQRPELDSLFGCLSDEELENLSGYLEKIIAALESQLGEERGEPDWDGFPDERRGFFRGHGHPGFGEGGCGRDPRGFGRGGFGPRPGFGPDGMRSDGEFREL